MIVFLSNRKPLWDYMKRLGFCYEQISNVTVPLDFVSFTAHLAAYFRYLDDLRNNNVLLYYRDETKCNVDEEKRLILLNQKSEGRFRKTGRKGKELAIPAMINGTGFDKDIFSCDYNHCMNSTNFID